MFSLKFHDDDNFKSFLNDLKDDERRSIIFQDINNSDLVTKNIIHAVILKELGENVFEHSESQIANIIMTKHQALPPRALPFRFSHTLTETPVISLVISDFGLGINERLRSAYLEDTILPSDEKLEDPAESDVIKYAFLKHSTSRSDKQRKEKLASRLTSKSLEYPLPTGLYKIKNTVQEHRGILVVRSGKTIVGFDYFSRPGTLLTHTNTENRELKNLVFFPGTQFNLIFPYRKLAPIRTSLTLNSLEKSKVTHNLVDHISLNSYIRVPITDITSTEIDQLQSLLDHFDQLRLKHIKGRNAAILDVDNFTNVSEKNIKHIIVTSAMAAQTNTLAIILVNFDRSSFSDLNRDYAEDRSFSFLRPLLAYDILFKPRIVGLQYSSFYEFLQRCQEEPDSSELKEQVEKMVIVYLPLCSSRPIV